MSHAPTVVAELLRPALRRAVTLIGICALLLAAASMVSAPEVHGLTAPHHAAAVTDCATGAEDGCAGHAAGQTCSLLGGCAATGVLPSGPVVAAAPGTGWRESSVARLADWADLPAKPPPILRA